MPRFRVRREEEETSTITTVRYATIYVPERIDPEEYIKSHEFSVKWVAPEEDEDLEAIEAECSFRFEMIPDDGSEVYGTPQEHDLSQEDLFGLTVR